LVCSITKISQAVKTKGRYNIFVDEKYSFSLDESQLLNLGIKKDLEISEEELISFKKESDFGKNYLRVLNLISYRQRSEKEIRDYAFKKRWDVEDCNRIIERLKKQRYLNDEKFAENFVRSKSNNRNFSKSKMKMELIKKGIKKDVIEQILSESDFNELDSLKNLLIKKLSRYDEEEKLIQYLMCQGFRYDDIKSTLDEIR